MAKSVKKQADPKVVKARSAAFAERFKLIVDEVKEHMAEEAMNAARKITSLVNIEQKKAIKDGKIVKLHDGDLLRIQLDAAAKVLKYNGIEVDHHEVSGKGGGPILIEEGHAKKIREAAAR